MFATSELRRLRASLRGHTQIMISAVSALSERVRVELEKLALSRAPR